MWTLIILLGVLAFTAWMMTQASKRSIEEWDDQGFSPMFQQTLGEYERGIYEQGLLAGHLMTKTGTFDRNDMRGMSADWVVAQQESNRAFS